MGEVHNVRGILSLNPESGDSLCLISFILSVVPHNHAHMQMRGKEEGHIRHMRTFARSVTLRGYFRKFLLSHAPLPDTSNFFFFFFSLFSYAGPGLYMEWLTSLCNIKTLQEMHTAQHKRAWFLGSRRWGERRRQRARERDLTHTCILTGMQKHTHERWDANVAHTLSRLAHTLLRLDWLISEADNTIPHVARSIIVGQGLHYKALDCGLDGPLKGKRQSLPEPWKRGKAA